jgi:hypothetical protein
MALAVFRNAIFSRELPLGMWCESTFPPLILLLGASLSHAVNCLADGNFRIPSSPISLIIAMIKPSLTPSTAIKSTPSKYW